MEERFWWYEWEDLFLPFADATFGAFDDHWDGPWWNTIEMYDPKMWENRYIPPTIIEWFRLFWPIISYCGCV